MQAVRAIPRDVLFTLDVRGPMLDAETRRFAGELRRIADEDPRVTIGAGLPAPEIPAHLAALDALVCPSMWFENGPTVALEAMAVGTPVIASRVGNLAEAIDDDVTGRLVTPGDVVEWAGALTAIAQSPDTIDRWRRALPAPRTMDDIARDYLKLYAACHGGTNTDARPAARLRRACHGARLRRRQRAGARRGGSPATAGGGPVQH